MEIKSPSVDSGAASGDYSPETGRPSSDELCKKFGWSVRMDHRFPETWDSVCIPRLKQIGDLLPLFIRYLFWWFKTWIVRRVKPFIDFITLNGKQIYGVPVGGIGSGSIGRGFKGEFCRYHMVPGIYSYDVVDANQFILCVRDTKGTVLYQKVLSGVGKPENGNLSSWDWSFNPCDGHYTGLYPRAWYTFNIHKLNLVLECKQVSPVIPHDYVDSCLPCTAFQWTIKNNSTERRIISITFTFKNGTGSKKDKYGKCSSETFSTACDSSKVKGVALQHMIEGIQTTYGIGCLEKKDQCVTSMNQFDLLHGSDLWLKLSQTGRLDTESCSYELTKGETGIAVNCIGEVDPKGMEEMIFTLGWDQPQIKFKGREWTHTRRYTRYIKRTNNSDSACEIKPTTIAIQNLAAHCILNYKKWDQAIDKWQLPVLTNKNLPAWFKSAIFNETYFISDGGTLWLEYDGDTLPKTVTKKEDLRNEFGRFCYLEAHEYRMFNTYDVHFYASFALAQLWPKLQHSLQYDMADAVNSKDDTMRLHLFDGHRSQRKIADSVPHDFGDPSEDPYLKINSYLMHDVSGWRDLNLKFVLQVFRDWKLSADSTYLNDLLPICEKVMKKSLEWDQDGDGVIENSGSADQTYDTWVMKGVSAYCGSLWLASLFAMIDMLKNSTDFPNKQNLIDEYQNTLDRGKVSFHEKLWTGNYYRFDTSGSSHGESIMSDQLCGHWFLAMCGVDDSEIFPKANVLRALKTIFENNVMKVRDGTMGAINGMNPDSSIDTFTMQSEETWTGVSYALGATMIKNGMTEEGFRTAEGIYRTVYETIGMGFETPEALQHREKYRAIGYMRALGIWSIMSAIKSQ
ncbi:non-lysosomal glucosylceramidase [Folsomia candida]|uniref:non-lysosomal glucosylceramidase n=1 Tax=Folsomia candida TaxID=158441 RepID=UPI000B8F6245|nr:non-lysosomal glucosylceramidase [Folsomia candida]